MTGDLSFEVKESDLMGRLGTVKLGRRRFETPCLTPVVHPVWRDIPIPQFKAMGFEVLMTNSYILYKRNREEAEEKGLHRLLGYDGAIMTDSGGYQVLEYGDADVSPRAIGAFQAAIGSDLAVTLDKPTGYSDSRARASETMRVSLEAAKETIAEFGREETVWVGPIQGGVFGDLVRRSARGLVRAGFQMVALGSPVELMEGYLFTPLVDMIVNARDSIPYSMPLHLFGAGHPLTLPLSIALGCDTFDSASYMLFAKKDRYMTERGTLELERLTTLPCSCPACNATSVSGLRDAPREERVRALSLHNLHVLRADVLRCRQAIHEGRLWDLVEERAMAHPRAAGAFRALAGERPDYLIKPSRLIKLRGLLVRSEEDAARPELAMARARLKRVMASRRRAARGRTAILVPGDSPPPLTRTSAGLGRAKGTDGADVYRINSQLGPYPAELEFVFPFTQTVSERSSADASAEAVAGALRDMGYSRVFVAGARRRARRRRGPKAPRSR